MANVLPKDKQIAVIGALAEGSSIRSIERMTGIHRDTIMRLGVRIGQGCEMLLDSKMQDLGCNYTVWEGIVEVFELKGHETAHRAYAWAHDTDDPEHPRRHVTVLHLHPIRSAQDAVRAAIVQEFKERNAEA